MMQELSNWIVLIVDDEPDNIDVVRLIMEFHDVTVWTAASGQECLDRLEKGQPTLLLVDIQMPVMSGLDLLEKVRARWPQIPAIALTAYSMQGDKERMLAAGFDGYVGKPINAMSLVDDILAIMNERPE